MTTDPTQISSSAIPPQAPPQAPSSQFADPPEKWTDLPEPVRNKLSELMQEAKKAKADKRAAQESLDKILAATDGVSVQEAIDKIKEQKAQQSKLEEQQRLLKDSQLAAQQELRQTYQKQIDDLQKLLDETTSLRTKESQQRSLERAFTQNGGIGFEYFNTLLSVDFKPVYDENNNLTEILRKDGSSVFLDDSTKPASVKQILLAMQKGQLGAVYSNLFQPYNRTSGANFPSGQSGGTSVVVGKKTKTGIPIIGENESTAIIEKRYIA